MQSRSNIASEPQAILNELKIKAQNLRPTAYCTASYGRREQDDLYTILDRATGEKLSKDSPSMLEAWDDALANLRGDPACQ